MNARWMSGLADVTRLTRQGRLPEAVGLIRKALSAGPPPPGMAPDVAATGTGGRGGPSAPSAAPSGQAWRPGPAATAPGARFEERTYVGREGSCRYKLYVPGGHAGRPLPLVVMLHGCTQSPDDFASGTRMNEVAEDLGFLVAYPAQAQAANPSRCWNWFKASEQQRDRGEPDLIAGITRQVIAECSVSESQVYVAGLSAGGAAAAVMGALYPDLYAAVGVHSGLACGAARDLPSAMAAMRKGGAPAAGSRRTSPPTIVFHGDRDKTVHPDNARHVVAQAGGGTSRGGTTEHGGTTSGVRYTRRVESGPAGISTVEHWTLHDVGHVWSGGSPEGSYTDPRGPDASREMIRFFLQHRLGGEAR